jgi:hypothetical protein
MTDHSERVASHPYATVNMVNHGHSIIRSFGHLANPPVDELTNRPIGESR